VRAGDPGAAEVIFRQYVRRLIGLARRRLESQGLLGKVEPDDVVQSAFRSFFVRFGDGPFDGAAPDSLWGLLARITLRKCNRQLERLRADRRDVAREVPLASGDSAAGEPPAAGREPSPEEAAALEETVLLVMARLGSPLKRQIFELSLQGYSVAEISERVHFYERGVERVRAEVKAALQQLQAS
jgi:RNA polymerase sigma-70 factor (ECF subfamily)